MDLIIIPERDGCDIIVLKFGIPILNHIKGCPVEYFNKIEKFIIERGCIENIYVDHSGYGIAIYNELENMIKVLKMKTQIYPMSHSNKLFK